VADNRSNDGPDIDLVSASSYANGHPWEQYAWLRENAPVFWHEEADGPGFWAITKYDDIRSISRQPKVFSSYARGVMMAESDEAGLAAQRQMMLVMDPPQHDRFKLLVSRGFTPKNAQNLVGRVADLSREIIDDVIERGECDLVHDVTGRLPSGLIAELMGMPRSDGERLYELTLVTAEVDGDRLTDAEFQWFFLLLVNAGGDTTRNLLAAGMQLLFDNPDQRARLMGDLDGLLGTSIEEMLRSSSPVVNFRRTAMEDVEIRGTQVKAGDKLMVFYGSGNRDADMFAAPDSFDVGRNPNPHMAFGGGGPHLCLGLHVARIEIAAMLRELLTRVPDLAPAGVPEVLASNFIAGVRTMPVTFTPGERVGA
jgi:cytochrome P450